MEREGDVNSEQKSSITKSSFNKSVVGQGWQTRAHGPIPAHFLFLLVKFYWHTATAIYWLLSAGNSDRIASHSMALKAPNIYHLTLYRKKC